MSEPLRMVRAKKADGSWRPGSRVMDANYDKLGEGLVRRLLESPHPLPEVDAEGQLQRWVPTRWVMKAAWEAVHGKQCALAALKPGWAVSAQPGMSQEYVVDLYRKLTADFGSPSEEVCGTGERAHGRCSRSFVFSAQLRQWLHEVPTFVQNHVPAGWMPPPDGPRDEPLVVDTAPQPYMPESGAGYTWRAVEEPPSFALEGPPPHYAPPPPHYAPPPPPLRAPSPSSRASSARSASPSAALQRSAAARVAAARVNSPRRQQRSPAPFSQGPRYKGATPGRSDCSHAACKRSPRRANAPLPTGARSEGSVGSLAADDSRPERLLGALAAGIRVKLHEDLIRTHDLFRAWDRDEDGRLSVDELLAGAAQIGMPGHASTCTTILDRL